MDINYYKRYEPIFGVWHITHQIGEGSFGKVFELEREDFGVTYKAALKAITIPASQSEVEDMLAEMTDEASVKTYYGTFVKELVEESALMSRLKGNSNIVSYENHQVIEHKEGVGWDVLIQMELLTPLNRYIKEHTVTRQDIIKLGIDLCKALELCQKFNIIHRDIKPENIFVSDAGDFKLGDFGIARTIEKTTGGLSKKGTYNYMAPEVYKGEPYGSTVDIYSLGIVLYRLLNENRTPFLPAYPAPITHRDRENALGKRFGGAPLPMPVNGTGRLGEIVLRACAYLSKDRYSSPAQMRQELEAILYNREEAPYIYPEGDQVEQKSVEYIKTGEEGPAAYCEATQRDSTVGGGTYSGFGSGQGEQTVSDFGGTWSERTVSDFTSRTGETSGPAGGFNRDSPGGGSGTAEDKNPPSGGSGAAGTAERKKAADTPGAAGTAERKKVTDTPGAAGREQLIRFWKGKLPQISTRFIPNCYYAPNIPCELLELAAARIRPPVSPDKVVALLSMRKPGQHGTGGTPALRRTGFVGILATDTMAALLGPSGLKYGSIVVPYQQIKDVKVVEDSNLGCHKLKVLLKDGKILLFSPEETFYDTFNHAALRGALVELERG